MAADVRVTMAEKRVRKALGSRAARKPSERESPIDLVATVVAKGDWPWRRNLRAGFGRTKEQGRALLTDEVMTVGGD